MALDITQRRDIRRSVHPLFNGLIKCSLLSHVSETRACCFVLVVAVAGELKLPKTPPTIWMRVDR